MNLASLTYFCFLAIVVFAFYLIKPPLRWTVLLLSSCLFYMSWRPAYIALILLTASLNYFLAIWMAREQKKEKRRRYLWLSLFYGLSILFLFKYLNFFAAHIRDLFPGQGSSDLSPILKLLLPIGISFYTLQTIGYMIDVYHGKIEPERHFGLFAVYVSFFPIILSGPIERSKHLLPQLKEVHGTVFSCANITQGVKLILLGLFYKLVVADRAALYVNAVFDNAEKHSGLTFIVAVIFFSFQVYSDFAGYSSIAIGSAKLLGIDILQNFNRPYFAATIKDFWRRWHISLSTWLRDYLFLPLAYSLSRRWKKEAYLSIRTDRLIYTTAILITFIICGLWHGADWTFITWGCLYGIYLSVENIFRVRSKRTLFKIGLTYLLTLFAWIFFRANSITEAFGIIVKILTKPGRIFIPQGPDVAAPVYTAIGISFLLLIEFKQEFLPGMFSVFSNKRECVRIIAYATLLALIISIGVFDGGQFIYLQF
jgi:alginate O-acetyltransferase complex protein AlgI